MGLRDRFVVKWTGKLTISRSGRYKFQTCSDDGSNLYVGSRKVVNNDGLHGTRCREGSYDLRKGQHDITVNFFENGGGAVCYVKYKGPDVGNGWHWLRVEHLPGSSTQPPPRPPPTNTGSWQGEFFRWNGGISRLPSVSGKTPSKVVAARQINYADAAFAALGFKDRCVNMLQNHTCDVGVGVRLKRAFAFGLA